MMAGIDLIQTFPSLYCSLHQALFPAGVIPIIASGGWLCRSVGVRQSNFQGIHLPCTLIKHNVVFAIDHRATMSNQEQHLALRAGPQQAVTIFATQKTAPSCSGRCARRYV
jgi:hypothetical protein